MRILFCNYEYPELGGGGGILNAALARELAKRHEVTVLTSRGAGSPYESVENGVRVVRVPILFRRNPAAASFTSMLSYVLNGAYRGRRLMQREARFDLINTHFALPSGPVGHVLARSAHIPNVLSVHGGDLYDPSKWSSAHRHATLRLCVRRLTRGAQAVVAQSEDTLANLRRYFVPEVGATVIPLGIPAPPAVAARRADYGFAGDDRVMISIGRLVRRKAFDQLIDTVAELRDPRVKLVLIGTGPLAETLRDRARERGVAGQVLFTGALSEREKFAMLSIADVYASTSQHEGFGLVFLEAMVSGLPVVCYGKGGQNDFLEDGVTGHVVPVNDRAAFAERCARLLGDAEARAAMRAENRRRSKRFRIETCAARYEALFESVLRTHPVHALGAHT